METRTGGGNQIVEIRKGELAPNLARTSIKESQQDGGNKGGRGMIQLELSYKTTTIGLSEYLENSDDWMLQLVNKHENSNKLHSVLKESAKFSWQLNLDTDNRNLNQLTPEIARETKKAAKNNGLKQLESRWQEKPLYGQFAA
eukprot:gene8080-13995_t